jgi:flagellar assembly protein FliH
MPSSDTIIKAKNVKLLREHPDPVSLIAEKTAGKGNAPLSRPGVTGAEQEQGKLRKLISSVKKETYEKGFAEGMEFRKQELLASVAAMAAAVAEIKTLKKQFYAENEKEVLELALAVAQKVIHTEVRTSREVVLAVLRDAVKKVADENGLKVRLNPEDLRFIMEMKQDLLQENVVFKNAVFEGDAGIKRGGVVLGTDHLEVDARLEQQFDKIKEALKI